MRKTNKLFITVLTVAMILMMNTIGAMALATFTDVPDTHWGNDFIKKMSNEGIITGYSDATFRPEDDVTKLQAIIMIYRTIKETDKLGNIDMDELIYDYTSLITSNNIPNWTDAQESVAFALEKGIITQSDLKTFITSGEHKPARRIEISRYLGKALNLYLKENISNNFYSFSFNDIEIIGRDDYPYLNLLINKNIIDSKGDYQGNFNPNNAINRAATAKILSMSYDVLEDLDIEEEPEIDEDVEVREATVDLINKDMNVIRVVNEDGGKNTYMLGSDAEIVINNQSAKLSDLSTGQNIKIHIKNEKLIKIVTDDLSSYEKGEVHSVIDMNSYYLVTLQNENNSRRTFKLEYNSSVRINGERANGRELEKGQKIVNIDIEVENDGEYIGSIEVEGGEKIYEGIIETPYAFGEYLKITIRTYGQNIIELEVDEDAEIRKNDRKRSLQTLTKGDLVTLYTENDVVVKIEAVSIVEDDEGVIREIIISNTPKITIENDNEEIITYDMSIDVNIEIDDEDAEIYDLRLGYRVKLDIESGTVKGLEATKVENSNSITGIVTDVYGDNDAIMVEIDNNGKKEKVSIYVDDARMEDEDGDRIYIRNIDKGDEVLIFGKKENSGIFNYLAERLYIIKRK